MIEFKNVSKTYGTGTEAVHNASFTIDKGEFAFLVGTSGSGKSTLIKLILKEEEASKGNIIINGKNIYPEELEILINKIEGIKESMIYGMPEDGDLTISAKVVNDKKAMNELYGLETEEKIEEFINEEIKRINKTMPAYKYIRNVMITEEELIKTTTLKIKRHEEMKKILNSK